MVTSTAENDEHNSQHEHDTAADTRYYDNRLQWQRLITRLHRRHSLPQHTYSGHALNYKQYAIDIAINHLFDDSAEMDYTIQINIRQSRSTSVLIHPNIWPHGRCMSTSYSYHASHAL